MREQDAFRQIHLDWRKQGYPFAFLVPSLATAIGSSGDRPEALAHLMGIIMNDGVELPTVKIEKLSFAAEYAVRNRARDHARSAQARLPSEVASTVRRALANVVAEGTGVRFRGAYHDARRRAAGRRRQDRHRRQSLRQLSGNGRQLASSRVVDRTATFVFFLGDATTARSPPMSRVRRLRSYKFTSALAVQLLKSMAPQLQPLIDKTPVPDVAGVRPNLAPVGGVVRATFATSGR